MTVRRKQFPMGERKRRGKKGNGGIMKIKSGRCKKNVSLLIDDTPSEEKRNKYLENGIKSSKD